MSEGLYCRHALYFCLSSPGTLSAIRTTCFRKCTAHRDCLLLCVFFQDFAASGVRQRILWFRDHLSVGREIFAVSWWVIGPGTLNTWMVAEAGSSFFGIPFHEAKLECVRNYSSTNCLLTSANSSQILHVFQSLFSLLLRIFIKFYFQQLLS